MYQSFDYLHLVYLLAWLILVAPAAAYVLRDRSRALRHAVLWLIAAVALTYFYKSFGWPFGG